MNLDEKLALRSRKKKTLGNIIQEYRQKNGWTQEELAWRAGIKREHIGRMERDQCVPSIATLESLEKAFGLSFMTLLQKTAEDT